MVVECTIAQEASEAQLTEVGRHVAEAVTQIDGTDGGEEEALTDGLVQNGGAADERQTPSCVPLSRPLLTYIHDSATTTKAWPLEH